MPNYIWAFLFLFMATVFVVEVILYEYDKRQPQHPRKQTANEWYCHCDSCGQRFHGATAWDCAVAYTRHHYAMHEIERAS